MCKLICENAIFLEAELFIALYDKKNVICHKNTSIHFHTVEEQLLPIHFRITIYFEQTLSATSFCKRKC